MSKPANQWPSEWSAAEPGTAWEANDASSGELTAEFVAAIEGDPGSSGMAERLKVALDANKPAKAIIEDFDGADATDAQQFENPFRGGWPLAVAALSHFRKHPTAETWSALWRLGYYSAAFEQDFDQLVRFVAKNDATFRELFLRVASDVLGQAQGAPGRRVSPREREGYAALLGAWTAAPSLLEIWWGLRGSNHYLSAGDDDGVLAIVAELDISLFIRHIATFDQPYSIQHALNAAGASRSMACWQQMVAAAPKAFEADGRWTTSSVLPLLLVIARNQLHDGYHQMQPRGAQISATSVADLENVAKIIADTVAGRADAGPTTRRWAAWLFRQVLTLLSQDPKARTPASGGRAYPDALLISSLAAASPSDIWTPPASEDCEGWETWCDRGARISAALTGRATLPEAASFLAEWLLATDDAYSDRGTELAEHASMFVTFGKRPDAYGAVLLALPLLETADPAATWSQFWSGCESIRELIEYDDYSITEEGINRLSSSHARELMQLAFGIGLGVLDQLALSPADVQAKKTASVEHLFGALLTAVNEMTAIDKFDTTYWRSALQHLVIRRALWSSDDAARSATRVFSDDFKPGVAEVLSQAAGDHELVFLLIDAVLRNGVPAPLVASAVQSAKVDLDEYLALAARLMMVGDKRLALSEEHMKAVEAVRDAMKPE